MKENDNKPAADAPVPEEKAVANKEKRHLIRPKWLRIILKTFFWIIVAILLIPVLLYIPPVQT